MKKLAGHAQQSHPSRVKKAVFNVLLILAAYGYLIYTFVTFDNYPELLEHFRTAGWVQYGALCLAATLIPLNFFLEACKWQYLQMAVPAP